LGKDNIEKLLPHDYRAIVGRCLADGKTIRDIEISYGHRTLLWTFAPLMKQRVVHGYGLEITRRRKAEEEARAVVVEKQAAEAANQAKSVFLANMSHEIRTPLNGVMGFLKLLSKTPLTEMQRDYLNTTEVSAKMLLTVINDILDFSKIEAGKVSIEQVEIEFRELLEEIVSLHTANAEHKGIDLVFVYSKEVPLRLLGDPTRISQVLSNLIGNAIKFTQHGMVLIDVNLKEETDNDVLVEISVKDSGIGISPDALERMFQPFSQADISTTRKYGGTGLGLVIAKTLVELMGGEIAVESQVGKGTRFAFTIRLAMQRTDYAGRKFGGGESRLRILTVTPNTEVVRSLTENFASWGIDTDSVSSCESALASMNKVADEQQPYAAVILDQAANDMTEKDFSGRIKTLGQPADIPMILMGGLSTCLRADEIRAEGYAACISKPAKSSELYNELSKIFLFPEKEIVAEKNRTFHLQSVKSGGIARVLIVDDNEINRKLAKILVEQMGGETDMAENGAQAVEACAQKSYDLILMDAHMPVMDGVEATIKIREAEKNNKRHTLIIALTADALTGDRKRYMDAGMDEYLSKPINEKMFVNTLYRLGLIDERRASNPRSNAASDNADKSSTGDLIRQDEKAMLPLLDPKLGVELSFGDRDTWRTVLGMLFDSLSEYSDSLIAAADNLEEVRQISHKLSGASSYCGTPALQHTAKQVELLAKTGDIASTMKEKDALLQQIRLLLALKINGQLPDGENPVY
jgi:two-component system, sensor histidine kinase and response regulator